MSSQSMTVIKLKKGMLCVSYGKLDDVIPFSHRMTLGESSAFQCVNQATQNFAPGYIQLLLSCAVRQLSSTDCDRALLQLA